MACAHKEPLHVSIESKFHLKILSCLTAVVLVMRYRGSNGTSSHSKHEGCEDEPPAITSAVEDSTLFFAVVVRLSYDVMTVR